LAGDITEEGLTIHNATDIDYYRLTAPGNGTLTVDLFFPHVDGDLDLRLQDTNGTDLATSTSTDDNEHIEHPVSAGSNYVVFVEGYLGASNVYDLVIQGTGDRFETNDTLQTAANLGTLGSRYEPTLTIHAAQDDDYFAFTASNAGVVSVTIEFPHDDGDLDLYLYDSQSNHVANSTSSTDDEGLSYTVRGGSNYFVRVEGYGDVNVYDLEIELGPLTNDRFETNDSPAQATDLGLAGIIEEGGLSIHDDSDFDYYRLTAAGDGDLTVDLFFAHQYGDVDLRLQDTNGADLAVSTSTDDNESLSYPVMAGSNYFVFVQGFGNASNVYDLVIDGPGDRFETNDTFETAADLGPVTNTLAENSLTIHEGEYNDYLLVTPTHAGTLEVNTYFTHAEGDLGLLLYDGEGGYLDHSYSTNNMESVSHTVRGGSNYVIRVYGNPNTYDLEILLGPLSGDRFETNDSPAQATALGLAGDIEEDELSIHDSSDLDYFLLTAAGDGNLTVDLSFLHQYGDLDLRLQSTDGADLAISTSTDDNESLSHPVMAGSNYYVLVHGWDNASNVYDLVIDGPGDRFETNDTFETAADLGLVTNALLEGFLTIHEGEHSDYLLVTPTHAGTLEVNTYFTHADGDLSLLLYDGEGGYLDYSDSTNNTESVSHTVRGGSNYVIRVYGNPNAYDLEILLGPLSGDRFETNNIKGEATTLGILGHLEEDDLSIHESGDVDVFLVRTSSDGPLNVDILFAHAHGDLDLFLEDEGGVPLASSLSVDDNESLSYSAQAGSNYYVSVVGVADTTNIYDLVVNGPGYLADRFEANDAIIEATDFGGALPVNEEMLTIHDSSDDDYFLVTPPAVGTLHVDITFRDSAGDVELVLYNTNGSALAYSTSSTDNESISHMVYPNDDYFILVDGQTNGYDLSIVLGPPEPDRFETNNTPAQASALGSLSSASEKELTIHDATDVDYYQFIAAASAPQQISVLFRHSGGDLNLHVYDGSLSPIGSSTSATDNELVTINTTEGSAYYVRVIGTGTTSNAYDLVLAPAADAYEANESRGAAAELGLVGDRTLQGLTLHHTADDDYYRVTAGAPGPLDVSIFFDSSEADIELEIFDNTGLLLDGSYGVSGEENVSWTVTRGDTYFLRVSPYWQNTVYTMEIDGPEFEPNISALDELVGDQLAIRWFSFTGALYSVDMSTNLLMGFHETIHSNLLATPPLNSVTVNVNTAVSPACFRVELQD